MYSFMSKLIFFLTNCLLLSAASSELPNEISEQITRCRADDLEPWSYRGANNGPDHWGEMYSDCHGLRQSPIAIDTSKAVQQRGLNKLNFNYYTPMIRPMIRNDGHTIQVLSADSFWRWRSIYVYRSTFFLRETHFHWGSRKEVGSEHIIDGRQYPMEMHLVHINDRNETVVVAILFEEGEGTNAELQHIINEFPKVMYKDTEMRSPFRLDMMNFLPEHPASFYTYVGSFTTPECTQGVNWLVLKTPIFVGHAQMREFRKLFSSPQNVTENGCRISNNFRPVQHLHRRSVFSSL